MDGRNPAPPRRPWNDRSPCKYLPKNGVSWFQSGAEFRPSTVDSLQNQQGNWTNFCRSGAKGVYDLQFILATLFFGKVAGVLLLLPSCASHFFKTSKSSPLALAPSDQGSHQKRSDFHHEIGKSYLWSFWGRRESRICPVLSTLPCSFRGPFRCCVPCQTKG